MNQIKFQPQLTPKEMLKLGIFGGYYFEGKHNEYPKDWFQNAKISNSGYNVSLNCFKINSGLSRDEWRKNGWITKEDPLGWFQWYCRYSMGRRIWESISEYSQSAIGRRWTYGNIFCLKILTSPAFILHTSAR